MFEMDGAKQEPGSNTWWWQIGGEWYTILGFADAVGKADNWEDAPQFVIDAVKKELLKSRKKSRNCSILGPWFTWKCSNGKR